MLEIFTNTDQTLTQNSFITFDNVKFSDNRMVVNSAGTAITISTPGRYLVSFDGFGGSNTVDTEFSIQMYVNGIAQPCAQTANTVAVASTNSSLSFVTLIQVNNSCCCSNNKQVIQFVASSASAGTISHANVSIIRL